MKFDFDHYAHHVSAPIFWLFPNMSKETALGVVLLWSCVIVPLAVVAVIITLAIMVL